MGLVGTHLELDARASVRVRLTRSAQYAARAGYTCAEWLDEVPTELREQLTEREVRALRAVVFGGR